MFEILAGMIASLVVLETIEKGVCRLVEIKLKKEEDEKFYDEFEEDEDDYEG